MKDLLVSLTFDDALDRHLDRAVPLLEERNLFGTFFAPLNSPSLTARLPEWQAVAVKGHELGNYTIFHPAVSSKGYISDGNALENYTLDRMRIELVTANQILTAIDTRTERTLAYPCCNKVLGRPGVLKKVLQKAGLERTRLAGWVRDFSILDIGSMERDCSPLMSEMFVAARGGGFGNRSLNIVLRDRNNVPCVSGDGLDAGQLFANVETFQKSGNWLIFMFHGIGYGHRLICEEHHFKRFLERLDEDSNIRVMPFIAAAKIIFGEHSSG